MPHAAHLTIEAIPTLSLSVAQLSVTDILTAQISNTGDVTLEDLILTCTSSSGLFPPSTTRVSAIAPGSSLKINPRVDLDLMHLARVTKPAEETVNVALSATSPDGSTTPTPLAHAEATITVEPYRYWPGSTKPEALASFVDPWDPHIVTPYLRASELATSGEEPTTLLGYDSHDKDDVILFAIAIAQTLAEAIPTASQTPDEHGRHRIDPAFTPPHDFTHIPPCIIDSYEAFTTALGSRAEELSNSLYLHLALLFASLAERAGFHPLIALTTHTIYVGLWLIPEYFDEILTTDATSLTTRVANGVNDILLIDTQALLPHSRTSSSSQPLDVVPALQADHHELVCIDIKRARLAGIQPVGELFRESEQQSLRHAEAIPAPAELPRSRYLEPQSPTAITKRDVWERNLLDLSLRNPLLNMKIGNRFTPFLSFDIATVEDLLADGKHLTLHPFPQEEALSKTSFRQLIEERGLRTIYSSELDHKRLRTILREKDLDSLLTKLHRAARVSLEETGSNTLFVTLGALEWQRPGDPKHYYAPLLLVPVNLQRKNARSPYTIQARDEDALLNMSLVELLRREYELDLQGLNPLPRDKHGVDTAAIINTIRHLIADFPGWDVHELAGIGSFSFSNFLLWQDVHTHWEKISNNTLVSSLIEGHLTWDAEEMALPSHVESDGDLIAVQADASQLFAIKEAARGRSFVLHGPPGTGKSQVITGIIANALAHGKRVLFVAEKAAALDVVEQRLDALGASPFTLTVHSNKTTKHFILEQIELALNVRDVGNQSRYDTLDKLIHNLTHDLDSYAQTLAQVHYAGLTLREAIVRYRQADEQIEALAGARFLPAQSLYASADTHSSQHRMPIITLPDPYFDTLGDGAQLAADIRMVRDFATATQALEKQGIPPARHPLRSFENPVDPAALHSHLPALKALKAHALATLAVAESWTRAVGFEQVPLTRARLKYLASLALQGLEPSSVPHIWREHPERTQLEFELNSALSRLSGYDDFLRQHEQQWAASLFTLDPDELQRQWNEANTAGIFKRGKEKKLVVMTIASHCLGHCGEEDVLPAIALIRKGRELRAARDKRVEHVAAYLEPFNHGGIYDIDALIQALKEFAAVISGASSPEVENVRACIEQQPQLREQAKEFIERLEQIGPLEEAAGEFFSGVDAEANYLKSIADVCDFFIARSDDVQEWAQWHSYTQPLIDRGLGNVVDVVLEGCPASQLLSEFEFALYRTMCELIFATHHEVQKMNGAILEVRIDEYQKADELLRREAERKLYSVLAQQVRTLSYSSREIAILRRAIRSRGRNQSIRQLISSTPHALARLKPCMLMSPLAVAQYLDIENEEFDLVIFDEASQLQTCKAVGAIARAKHCVVVGDPQQMPPTSFFTTRTGEEDYDAASDLESVLEDCLAIHLPETYLEWHYRSRHESLISFSNKHFYKARLCTFPSADDSHSQVKYVHVPGFYNGNGLNTAEAQAVVDDVYRRYLSDPHAVSPSLGIVTFNVKQQTYIENLLDAAYQHDPAFDRWAHRGEEPLFVKNLENVQGDERDTILFSVTYAPDTKGTMAMRFGPLNMKGGERRLNVAITRSRREMVVFATLQAEDIDLRRTSARGVQALKEFLAFAKAGTYSGYSSNEVAISDAVVDSLVRQLRERGIDARAHIGSSRFRVDIAIPERDSSRYALGILLDSQRYLAARSTRERDIAHDELLAGLGWDLMHVWTIDWYKKPEDVLNSIVERIQALNYRRIGDPEPFTHKDEPDALPASPLHFDDVALHEAEENLEEGTTAEDDSFEEEVFEALTTHEAGGVEGTANVKAGTENVSSQERERDHSLDVLAPIGEETAGEGRAREESQADEALTPEVGSDQAAALGHSLEEADVVQERRGLGKHVALDLFRNPGDDKGAAKSDTGVAEGKPEHAHQAATEPSSAGGNGTAPQYQVIVRDDELERDGLPHLSAHEFLLKPQRALITERMRELIDYYAPIEKRRLITMVYESFELWNPTHETNDLCEEILSELTITMRQRGRDVFIWRVDQSPQTWHWVRHARNGAALFRIQDTPDEEILVALLLTLPHGEALTREDLIDYTAETLGFSAERKGKALTKAISAVIDKACTWNLLREANALFKRV